MIEAQERGVFFDTAHGRQNFSFDVAKSALDQGVRPRSISTDLTIPGRLNTVHSLAEMLSRFMALGFGLVDVIRMATSEPAKALEMDGEIGSLAVGRAADISVLEEHTGDWLFPRHGRRRAAKRQGANAGSGGKGGRSIHGGMGAAPHGAGCRTWREGGF